MQVVSGILSCIWCPSKNYWVLSIWYNIHKYIFPEPWNNPFMVINDKGEKLEQIYTNVQVGTKIWKYAQEKIGHELMGNYWSIELEWIQMDQEQSIMVWDFTEQEMHTSRGSKLVNICLMHLFVHYIACLHHICLIFLHTCV